MANRTVKDANSVKGTNPQYLVEKIIRSRIYESKYWKEQCFALSAELLVDKAMELRFIGGVFGGNVKPSPFLCLILKMLQIQPEKDIVIEFIKNDDFKYVRCLGAMYLRLIGESVEIYKYLEPLYNDYRKIRFQNRNGGYEPTHIDEFIDELLHEERVCSIILPRIQKRHILEEAEKLEPRVSALEEDLEVMESSSDEEEEIIKESRGRSVDRYRDHDRQRRSPSPRYRRSRSRSPHRNRRRRDSPHRRRNRSRSRERRRSRTPERRHRDRDHGDKHRSHRHAGADDDRRKSHKTKRSRHDRDYNDREHRHESRRERHKTESDEIAEANAVRASLGLAPLK
ncbi:pre-mRNA-splicing factor 38A-like [Anneissia japonica]|uniref:pre-mRNA-splicing factor 38A-like n=1 Tax=Anneissia japonica TaxID=1529436 RepID=UPI0014256626|nr:pre-mRNA-splicing factor 38A-like [Anneissia japonica]